MKTATIPSVRVEPEFRQTLESLLEEGESLSQFVESALRATAARRQAQSQFVRRGLVSIAETKLAAARQLKAQAKVKPQSL